MLVQQGHLYIKVFSLIKSTARLLMYREGGAAALTKLENCILSLLETFKINFKNTNDKSLQYPVKGCHSIRYRDTFNFHYFNRYILCYIDDVGIDKNQSFKKHIFHVAGFLCEE